MGISRVGLIGLSMTVSACGYVPEAPLFGPGPNSRLAEYTTVPSPFPSTLVVGRPVRITVILRGADAQPDRRVAYLSASREVRWIIPDPPCPQNTCADIVGIAPTDPADDSFVTIMVCGEGDGLLCPGRPHHLNVVPE